MFSLIAMMAIDIVDAPRWSLPLGMTFDFVCVIGIAFMVAHHG